MTNNNDQLKILGHIGVGGQKGYIYDISGVISCLPASQWKDPCKIVVKYSRISENNSMSKN